MGTVNAGAAMSLDGKVALVGIGAPLVSKAVWRHAARCSALFAL